MGHHAAGSYGIHQRSELLTRAEDISAAKAQLVGAVKGYIARAVAECVASMNANTDELKAEIAQLKRRVDELEQQAATTT